MDRKELKERIRPFVNGKDGPDINGYHKVVLRRVDGRYPGEESRCAFEWCSENIGRPDNWESDRRWLTTGVAFYFTKQEDQIMFNLIFS